MPYDWTFAQVEGKSDRKTLTLKGWNAPFGRPRREPIFTEIIKSRVQTSYYPGVDGSPTRHTFGTNYEPMELKGRWMTPQLIPDGKTANQFANDWVAFVKDQRQCRMSWGLILSYVVFIEELQLARESENQIAWKMKIQIDKSDESKGPTPSAVPAPFDRDYTELGKSAAALSPPDIPSLSPDLLDQLDNLAAALNEPQAALNRLVGQIGEIEKATFSTIQHFRSALTGFRQATVAFDNLVQTTSVDSANLVRSPSSDIAWSRYQADIDLQTIAILYSLAKLERKVELKARSEASKLITAIEGDTWETLSLRSTGDYGSSALIREMNGATYGEQPVVGETYLAP